ncbi:VOC family protein [Yokenella regensburgei]|uniref:VOC family protein n=1 Tax=Yokenella regensburgei TaxID=158877 RepID=UPI003F147078
MNNIINWFEIPAADLERATHFYEYCVGATFRQEHVAGISMAVFEYNAPSIGGALVKSPMFQPSTSGTVVYLFTPDITASLKKVSEKGGTCCFGPEILPEGIGTIALIIDSEGNRVGLHQPA